MARRRGYEQVRDMTLSLGLVIAFVFLTVAFLGGSLGILRADPNAREVRPVDYADELRTAVAGADYEVLAPADVPEGWVSQSARTAVPEPPGSASLLLQIGFLTPERRYATVLQTDADLERVLDEQRIAEDVEAAVEVDGQEWEQRRRVDRDEIALLRTDGARTVVVTGDAPLADLRRLAAGLEPADHLPGGTPDGGSGQFQPID